MDNSVPLRLEGISKSYGPVQALEPLDLDVRPGEMLALLGPSGCGKTTTLRIVAGFESPDTGSVLIGGRDVTELSPHRRGLGMVFQNYSLFPHMNVAENVAFGLKMHGIPGPDRTRKVRDMLRLVRLGDFEDRPVHKLSGGQQQRVALARSLVTDPSILLLDEPLGALDKHLRERMQFELREIQRRLGITSILVTHDQEEALTMADRVAVMSDGRIRQIGSPIEIYERPQSRFVSEFLGAANIFEGRLLGHAGPDFLTVALDGMEGPMQVAASGRPIPVGSRLRVAVRPERMRFAGASEGLTARVHDVVFRGSYYAYELETAGRKEPIYVYSSACDAPVQSVVGLDWDREFAIVLADDDAGLDQGVAA